MITKHLATPALLAVSLGLAACGGSTSAPLAAGPRPTTGTGSRPTTLYTVAMTGSAESPRGAPHGQGVAIIAFHGASRLCFRFSHLRGFVDATVAHIHSGTAGQSGPVVVALSSGPKLHHRGCQAISPRVSHAIWSRPSAYYVNVHSRRNPGGAVRAQL
jgi:CHRD domain